MPALIKLSSGPRLKRATGQRKRPIYIEQAKLRNVAEE
jgi:hypothetical protein